MSADLRVLVLAPYPLRSAPSQRFRFEQYVDLLRDDGIELDVHSLLDREAMAVLYQPGRLGRKAAAAARAAVRRIADVARARAHDLALIHREAFPLGYPVFERAVRALGVPYVFDFDDAIYLPNTSSANRTFAALKRPGKTAAIVRGARLVTA
ncbi:MAG: glycosyltransferase family 1 protein, partial [Chloroflexota bacterium]|nr:glycosyltransferase family 1 protein [Chloroflexota bacterium]